MMNIEWRRGERERASWRGSGDPSTGDTGMVFFLIIPAMVDTMYVED